MTEVPVPRDIPLPLPAPEPILVGVLVVFFLMHIVFVNLMVGGAFLTLWYELRGLKDKRFDRLAYAIAATITANKSIAVVLGVGPLLAINTIYTVYFYTANALTGAFWMSVIPLVTIAFVLTYVHKYQWNRMKAYKKTHIFVAFIVCLIFMIVPLIFLTNVNLMLFPERWETVRGFFSALTLPNVFPRYAHFLLACPAMTGLFLVWLFRRASQSDIDEIGFDRSDLVRKGYQWAFWPTAAQFVVGPIVLLTLPKIQEPIRLVHGVFGFAILLSLTMAHLMFAETRRSAEEIGRSFVPICLLMILVVSLMGTGRHLYREAAITPHRELVRVKTEEYMREVEKAKREAEENSSENSER